MNRLLQCSAGALVFLALVLPAIAAQPDAPTGVIRMELTKKPVNFNHATHAAVACGECHHQVNGEENYQKCSTSGCHDVLDQKDKSVNSYYQIAHNRKPKGEIKSCLSCHNALELDKDQKKALTGCVNSACHPKTGA